MSSNTQANGIHSPLTEKAALGSTTPRIVLAGKTGRILCVADIRGDYYELNRLIREHEATAVIHTGDFGFINVESLDRMGDKILRHLLTYSPLIPSGTRTQLLSLPWEGKDRPALHSALNSSSVHFPLSQFPHLLSGAITFTVPVFTVWGLIEDVKILERFRTGEYEVHNLSVLDEVATRSLDVGGLQLRLFGLGGAVASHKLFDNGEGHATIAGGGGTMWTTALQIGELVDTAQRVYDETETRLFVSSAPISRNGMLSQLANVLKADLTISGGLHFRYPAAFNEFSVHGNFQSYRNKLIEARDDFADLYASVKNQVDVSLNELQQSMLKKAIEMTQKIPPPEAEGSPDAAWTNTWHWVLSDASCGHLLFSIADGRVSAETKSTGLQFSHRIARLPAPPSAPITPAAFPTQIARRPSVHDSPPVAKPAVPPSARAGIPPSGPGVPPRPQNVTGPGPMNNIRGIAPRPQQQPQQPAIRPPPPSSNPSGPTNGVPAQNAQLSIPPKPPTQPRQSRGGGSLAGQALAAVGVGVTKDKAGPQEPSSAEATTSAPTSSKPPAPATNKTAPANAGKPTTPAASKPATPAAAGKPAASTGPGKSGTTLANGKPSPAQTPAPEKAAAAAEKRATEAAEKKPASSPKKKVTDALEKKATPTANGNAPNGEKSASTPASEDPADKGHSREGSMSEAKQISPKKHSLYVKGIPIPTNQDELKALFKSSDKITNVKIISDHMSRKQKVRLLAQNSAYTLQDFAYVDFNTEEDMQEALKSHTGTIRETEVNVSVSNPPSRFFNEPFRGGRGRGSFRGRGGMRGGFAGGAKKDGGDATGGSGGGEKKDSAPAMAVTTGGGDK